MVCGERLNLVRNTDKRIREYWCEFIDAMELVYFTLLDKRFT